MHTTSVCHLLCTCSCSCSCSCLCLSLHTFLCERKLYGRVYFILCVCVQFHNAFSPYTLRNREFLFLRFVFSFFACMQIMVCALRTQNHRLLSVSCITQKNHLHHHRRTHLAFTAVIEEMNIHFMFSSFAFFTHTHTTTTIKTLKKNKYGDAFLYTTILKLNMT